MSVADRAEPPLGETLSRWSTPTRVLVAVSAAFVLVALVVAGRKGFWLDEGFTAAFVRQPWSDFLHELTKIDINMAAYDIVAKVWVALFGTGEVALRSLSIAFLVATFPVAYTLFSRVYGSTTATLATTLVWSVAPAPGAHNDGWKEAAALLRRDSRTDEAIAFPNSDARIPVELYSRHDGQVGFSARPVLPSAGWGTLSPYGLARVNRLRLQRGPALVGKELATVTRLRVVGYAANIAPGLDMGVVDQAAKARGLRLDREYRFGDTLVRHYS